MAEVRETHGAVSSEKAEEFKQKGSEIYQKA